MNKEEILKIAKEKYPIGCVVESLGGSGHQTIKHHDFYILGNNVLRATSECLLLDSSGIWATIINLPIKCYELW